MTTGKRDLRGYSKKAVSGSEEIRDVGGTVGREFITGGASKVEGPREDKAHVDPMEAEINKIVNSIVYDLILRFPDVYAQNKIVKLVLDSLLNEREDVIADAMDREREAQEMKNTYAHAREIIGAARERMDN